MKTLILISFVLAAAAAGAQTTKQSQIPHVATSLNHLTVLEFGEPVTKLAVADSDSFRVESHDDTVLIEPLRDGVATNLLVWTASRQISYELDPAGQLAAMDVLIRNDPPPDPHAKARESAEASDAEIHKIASLVLAQTMMGVQDIAHDPVKAATDRVQIEIEQVYRSKDQLYILVSNTGVPRFTFFDEGQVTASCFERFLKRYQPLFEALGEFELIYVADAESNSARAQAAFNRFLPADRLRGVTSMTPLGVDHFLQYLDASRRYDAKNSVSSARDLEVLREGEHLYTTLEHRALQSAWNIQSTNAGKIRRRFSQNPLRATFTTVVLPYSYPIYNAAQKSPVQQGEETRRQTRQQTRKQDP